MSGDDYPPDIRHCERIALPVKRARAIRFTAHMPAQEGRAQCLIRKNRVGPSEVPMGLRPETFVD